MTRFDRLCENVREVLLRYWDPIGIRDVPKARDEYDQYAVPIANMVLAGNSAAALAKHLLAIEIDSMGLKGNQERARLVAEKLRIVGDALMRSP